MYIFVLESDPLTQLMIMKDLRERLGPGINIIAMDTIAKADEIIAREEWFNLFIIDGVVTLGYGPDATKLVRTSDLVRRIRAAYRVPIIALSNFAEYRREMMEAGCDQGARSSNVVDLAVQILKGV